MTEATALSRSELGDFDEVRAGSLLRSVSTRRLVRKDPVACLPPLSDAKSNVDELRWRGCHPSSSLLIALCGTCTSEPCLDGRVIRPGDPTEMLESLDQIDPFAEDSKDVLFPSISPL